MSPARGRTPAKAAADAHATDPLEMLYEQLQTLLNANEASPDLLRLMQPPSSLSEELKRRS